MAYGVSRVTIAGETIGVGAAVAAAVILPVPLLVIGAAWIALATTVLGRIAVTPRRTTPPGHTVVLYDGHCRICTAGADRLRPFVRSGAELASFQDAGVLDRFPGLTWDDCMKEMQTVTPDGRIYGGFEAAVRAIASRGPSGWFAYGYYLPIVRAILDGIYALIAANRYRIAGRTGACDDGACAIHFQKR
jgi:predicted DCC family thiol-disulfide oxidoreductase YuxK